jgi:hypothetical protein
MKSKIKQFRSKDILEKENITKSIQDTLNEYNTEVANRLDKGSIPKLIAIIQDDREKESELMVLTSGNVERKDLAIISLELAHQLMNN